MRIVALRGENLASLERFEVPLEAGPLGETGLFFIGGPTGAGKSTLLDAMCLALFDRVPRLVGARDPSGDELSPGDPRAVLRRGAGAARAEVDFVGRDGRLYRAVWEVWRARKSPSGRIQNQQVQLFDLTSEVELSGKHRTETLARIQERVGLDFDQFRRAVLLAQGDFSAFLRARPEERAQLLERMTRTERFGRISIAAFRRHRADLERLEALREDQHRTRPLDEGPRAELEAAHAEAEHARAQAAEALERRTHQIRLREQSDELRKELASSEERLRALQQRWETLAPQRELVSRMERLLPLRPAFDALVRGRRESERLEASIQTLSGIIAECERAAPPVRAEAEAAVRSAADVERQLEQEAEALAEARRRDAELKEGHEALARATELLPRTRAVLDETLASNRRLREAARRNDEDTKHTRAALRTFKAEVEWLGDWDSIATELERGLEARRTRMTLQVQLTALDDQLTNRRAQLAALSERFTATQRELDEARKETSLAREQMEALRRSGTSRSLAEASTRLSRLEASAQALAAELERARKDQRALRRLERDAERAAEAVRKSRADARRHTRARRQRQAELEELAQRTKLSVLMHELHVHRVDLLVVDQPCPLCGGSERGPTREPPASDATSARLRKLQTKVEELEERRQTAEASSRAEEQRRETLEERARDLERRIASSEHDWRAFRREIELLWVDSGVLGQLNAQSLALGLPETSDQASLRALEDALGDLQRDVEGRAHALERASTRLESAERVESDRRAAMEQSRTEVQEVTDGLTVGAGERALLEQRMGELERSSEQANARVQALGLSAPPQTEEALSSLKARVDEAAALAELERQQTQLGEDLDRDLLRATASVMNEHRKHEAQRAAVERARDHVDVLQRRRATLLGGRSVEQAVEDRESARTAARERNAQAQAKLREIERSLTARGAELQDRKSRQSELSAELAELRDAFARVAQDGGLEPNVAEQELRALPTEAESMAEEIAKLSTERAAARVEHEDRSQRLTRFEAQQGELPRGSELEASLADAKAAETACRERAAGLAAQRAADDAARTRWAEAAEKLDAAQRDAALSGELSELIGSADGKKLRTYAQGLTLGALLEASNAHLERLRPRYALLRAPGTDIDVQVLDRDLGDELRSASTLSGGETFLVSLALALGLSDLAADDVRIGSLFIDEGFGQLDRASLDVAISTLDTLQAEGRKVAVISHVPEVAERLGYGVEVEVVHPGRSRVRIKSSFCGLEG